MSETEKTRRRLLSQSQVDALEYVQAHGTKPVRVAPNTWKSLHDAAYVRALPQPKRWDITAAGKAELEWTLHRRTMKKGQRSSQEVALSTLETVYEVTFDRIGRNHHVAPLTVNVPSHLSDGEVLLHRIAKYAQQFLISRGIEIQLTMTEMVGSIIVGFHSGGEFTLKKIDPQAEGKPEQPNPLAGMTEEQIQTQAAETFARIPNPDEDDLFPYAPPIESPAPARLDQEVAEVVEKAPTTLVGVIEKALADKELSELVRAVHSNKRGVSVHMVQAETRGIQRQNNQRVLDTLRGLWTDGRTRVLTMTPYLGWVQTADWQTKLV